MLNTATASAGVLATNVSFDPWENVRLRFHADIVVDRKRCRDGSLLRRKFSKTTREREFGIAKVESSAVDDTMSWTGVRISNIVQVGEVEFWPDEPHIPCLPGSSRNVGSPRKSKKRRNINSPLTAKKKFSLAESPPVWPRKPVS